MYPQESVNSNVSVSSVMRSLFLHTDCTL